MRFHRLRLAPVPRVAPTPDPTPTPTPAPTTTPSRVTFSEAVIVGSDGPEWAFANRAMGIGWRRSSPAATPQSGGAWRDANNAADGSRPWATLTGFSGAARYLNVALPAGLIALLRTENTGLFLHCASESGVGAVFSSLQRTDLPYPPLLSIITTAGTFPCPLLVDTTIYNTQSGPDLFAINLTVGGAVQARSLLRFDMSAVTGTFVSASLQLYWIAYGGSPVSIDYLDMPELLTQPAVQHPELVEQGIASSVAVDSDLASHGSVVLRVDPSATTMTNLFDQGWYDVNAAGFPPTFGTWAEYGIPYFRTANGGPPTQLGATAVNTRQNFVNYPDLLARGRTYGHDWGTGLPTHLFLRYLFVIEDDYGHRMPAGSPHPYSHYEGCKIPNFQGVRSLISYTGFPSDFGDDDGWGMSAELAYPPSAVHGDAVGFASYVYDMDNVISSPNRGRFAYCNAALVRNHVYSIEVEVKINSTNGTTGAADGILRYWLDGVKVYEKTDCRWRNKSAGCIMQAAMLILNGGNGHPDDTQHFRIGGWTVSTEYIGPPKLQTTFPAWRSSMTLGQFSAISGTASMSSATATSGTIDAWNGLAAGPHTWYSAANGGHADSQENKVFKIDLSANSPAWVKVNDGTTGANGNPSGDHTYGWDTAYYTDGKPSSRHSYYTEQFIGARNRVMLFSAYALWGSGGAQSAKVDGYNVLTNTWDAAATFTDVPIYMPVMSVAKHPTTEDVYIGGWSNGPKWAKWTQATGVWTYIVPSGQSGVGTWDYHPSFIDPLRGKWVSINHGGTNVGAHLQAVTLTSNVFSTVEITGPLYSGGLATDMGGYPGACYDPDGDRYIVALPISDGSMNVYSLNPDTAVSTLIQTIAGPNPRTNGIVGRIAHFAELGGVAILPTFSTPIYFMRTR